MSDFVLNNSCCSRRRRRTETTNDAVGSLAAAVRLKILQHKISFGERARWRRRPKSLVVAEVDEGAVVDGHDGVGRGGGRLCFGRRGAGQEFPD